MLNGVIGSISRSYEMIVMGDIIVMIMIIVILSIDVISAESFSSLLFLSFFVWLHVCCYQN